MNLYNLHEDPQSLPHFGEAHEYVPNLFWDKYRNKPEELRKREAAISKDPDYAHYYSRHVLKGPFPAGEETIAEANATWRKDMRASRS